MANTRRAVRHDERSVVILGMILLMLVLTSGVIWLQVFRLLHDDQPALPVDPELSVLDLLPEVAQNDLGESAAPSNGRETDAAEAPRSRWTIDQLPTVFKQLPEEEPLVYLTFDDGPTKYLPAFVDVLAEKNAPAIFFWIGQYSPPDADVLEKMQGAHLQIGSHTVNHRNLKGRSYEVQRNEMIGGITRIAQWTGRDTVYVRPPYGAWDERTRQLAEESGVKLVLWSIDPRDWEKDANPDDIVEHVIAHLHPGAVILLHEKETTLQALPTLIDRIRESGYQLAGLPRE